MTRFILNPSRIIGRCQIDHYPVLKRIHRRYLSGGKLSGSDETVGHFHVVDGLHLPCGRRSGGGARPQTHYGNYAERDICDCRNKPFHLPYHVNRV